VTTTLADGTLTTGGLTTYTFVVGDLASVPEPASLGMMASGLVIIAAWRARRRKA